MSYNVHVCCSKCSNDLMGDDNNMTSNVSPIWDELGCEIREWSGKTGIEVLPLLQKALNAYANMTENELNELLAVAELAQWGKMIDAIDFLARIRNACALEPEAILQVSY